MGKHGIVYGKGINDMERGWRKANEWNQRIYQVWQNMILRGTTKFQETYPTYKGCTVCDRWLILSNFVEDIKLIDGYEYWLNHPNERVALDKDIKSNGKNKEYSLENCMFVSASENSKQANATRDNTKISEAMKGENHPMYNKHHSEETKKKISEANKGKLIDRFTIDGQYVDTHYRFEYIQMGFHHSHIGDCCKGRRKTHKGFIFKYHKG